MRTYAQNTKSARLGCEALEDRLTPVVAYTLGTVGLGIANLRAFDTTTPSITNDVPVTNLAANETLVGIDFRPQNGHLYALGVNATGTGTLYDISTRTGLASRVGPFGGVTTTDGLPNPALTGTAFAFDFNPLVDLVRVLASDGDNFVIDPNTGTTLANQTAVSTALGLTGTTYTNNAPNVTATTQYSIGSTADALYITPNPANGVANLVGPLGVGDFGVLNGFDIPAGVNVTTSGNAVTTGSGFAAIAIGGVSRFYTVNLVTGAATLVGTIGGGTSTVNGLAIQNDYGGFPAIGISGATPGAANLVRFNTATPGTTTTVAVTNLAAGDTLVGVAFRPATGQFYGLGVTAAGAGTLYLINPQTASASTIGTVVGMGLGALPNPATATSGYGFAFNATLDAIRVITSAGQSFAVNANTGAVLAVNTSVNGATTSVDGATYTNSFGQTAGVGNPTTLYVLDATSNRILVMNPGTGTTTAVATVTLNGAALDFSAVNGFDIPAGATTTLPNGTPVAAGFGYATLVAGTPGLYRINLTNGVATNLGALGTTLSGLSLADTPGGTVSFQSATVSGNEGGSVTVVLTRTATTGPQTVTVSRTSGSAFTADFTGGPFTVTFVDGQTTAALSIPLTADQLTEGPETLGLTLSAPGAALGAQFTTSVSIADTSVAPPVPPPFFSGALTIPGGIVLAGAGVPGGIAFLALPPGSAVFFADVNGDGKNDVVFFLPGLVAALDGQTGRFFALATDLTGDGITDFQVFNSDGSTTRVNGRTGMVF